MNVITEYNTAKKKKGNVTYGSLHAGRWVFRASDKNGAYEKIIRLSGGLPVAERIASIISAAWLRTANSKLSAPARIDAKARRMIDQLCEVRTLKDWDGEPEWWHNVTGEAPAVKMIFVNRSRITPPAPVSPEDLGLPVLDMAPVAAVAELIPA